MIRQTLDAIAVVAVQFRPDLSMVDPANRRRWAEGLACVLVSAGLMATVAALPEAWRVPHGRHWGGVLTAAVVGWVLNALGIRCVARADPAVDPGEHRSADFLGMQVSSKLAVLLPATFALQMASRHGKWGPAILVTTLAAAVACVGFHLRLRRLALAADAPSVAGLLGLLAVVMPLWSCGAFDVSGEAYESTLDLLLTLPNATCGPAAIPVFALRTLSSQRNLIGPAIGVAVPIGELSTIAAILWLILRPAGAGGSTAASSRP